MLSPALIREFQAQVGEDAVFTAAADLLTYSYDAAPLEAVMPALVVRPTSSAALSRAVRLCNQNGLPLTVRGAGTNLSGGTVPLTGGVVIVTNALNRILEINSEDMYAVVEPGVVTAKFAAAVLESSYVEISEELNYVIQKRVPVFVYNSHNDFQQTNIISSLIPEGVGGFTEAFKNRIVIPFSGSYEEFRHVLHHELTHAVIYDLLYGNMFSSLLSRQRLFQLPLWFAEGYAEYSSRHGWDYYSDMFVRDATINNYLAPPWYLGGFLAYKQGQAMVKYIADEYGEDQLGKILKKELVKMLAEGKLG